MKKSLINSLFISIIIAFVAGVAMFFIPVPSSGSSSNPDEITETTYGFPVAFKTSETGGFAGNLPDDSTINLGNLLLDIGAFAAVAFVLAFGTTALISRNKQQ